jgi:hypothetical protein
MDTDRDGMVVTLAPGGPLRVVARAPGAAPAHREIPAGSGSANITLRLHPGLTLSGRVVDARSGEPIAGAQLTLSQGDEPITERVTARAGRSGEFAFDDLPEGQLVVSAEAPSYGRGRTQARTPSSTPLLIKLSAAAYLTGHVLGPKGTPASGATVTARCRDGPISDASDASGSFSLEVPPGTHEVVAQLGTSSAALEHPVAVAAGQTRSGLELRLGASGAFTGRVHTEGRPVPGLSVQLSPRGMTGDMGRATSDGEGHWEIAGLPAGTYDLDVTGEGWSLEARQGLRLLAGQRFTIDLEMKPGAAVTGLVRDRSGPVAAATVSAGPTRTQTDDAGHFRLQGLPIGDVAVTGKRTGSAVVASKTLTLSPGATVDIELMLPDQGSVSGKVTLRDGRPATGTMLGFLRVPELRTTVEKVDESGQYSVQLEAGRYRVAPLGQLGMPEGTSGRYLTVSPGENQRADLTIDASGPDDVGLAGTVVEPDGTPSAGAQVVGTGKNLRSTVITDATGRFQLAFVPERIEATQGARHAEQYPEPEQREVTLRLSGTAQLRGKVLGTPPPSGFRLNAYPSSGNWTDREAIVFSGTTFELNDVRPGPTLVQVRTDDGRLGQASVVLKEGNTASVDVEIAATCSVKGRVSVPARAGSLGRGRVTMQHDETHQRRWDDVGADGNFMLTQIPRGPYLLSVRLGMFGASLPVVLGESCPVDVGTLELTPPHVPPGELGAFTSGTSPVITMVLPTSPAEAAGLLPGDELLTVDGTPMRPGEPSEAQLAGAPGSSVTVTYRRSSVTHTVVMVRAR